MRYWLKLIGIPVVTVLTAGIAAYLSFGHAVFHINHSRCFGTCPTYTVWIFDTGIVLYYGDKYVSHHGPRIGYMSSAQVEQFAVLYTTLIDHLPSSPSPDLMTTDMPTHSIAFTRRGQTRQITIEEIDESRFPLVNGFMNQLETVAQIPYWTGSKVQLPTRSMTLQRLCPEWPNTRMQPDAASRPQDRGHFGAWFQLQCCFGLPLRRG